MNIKKMFYLILLKKKVNAYLNVRSLKFLFENYEETNIILKVEDWLAPPGKKEHEKTDYFTVKEFIEDKHFVYI